MGLILLDQYVLEQGKDETSILRSLYGTKIQVDKKMWILKYMCMNNVKKYIQLLIIDMAMNNYNNAP